MITPAVLSVALLLLLRPAAPATGPDQIPISILVMNSVYPQPNKTYSTNMSSRGILLGGMRRLRHSNEDFTFSYIEDPNYGPFLVSVNCLIQCDQNRTYWELLVKTANGTVIRPNVGIGCYIPKPNDQIIFNFNNY